MEKQETVLQSMETLDGDDQRDNFIPNKFTIKSDGPLKMDIGDCIESLI